MKAGKFTFRERLIGHQPAVLVRDADDRMQHHPELAIQGVARSIRTGIMETGGLHLGRHFGLGIRSETMAHQCTGLPASSFWHSVICTITWLECS